MILTLQLVIDLIQFFPYIDWDALHSKISYRLNANALHFCELDQGNFCAVRHVHAGTGSDVKITDGHNAQADGTVVHTLAQSLPAGAVRVTASIDWALR